MLAITDIFGQVRQPPPGFLGSLTPLLQGVGMIERPLRSMEGTMSVAPAYFLLLLSCSATMTSSICLATLSSENNNFDLNTNRKTRLCFSTLRNIIPPLCDDYECLQENRPATLSITILRAR